jgi:hypothetical protein
MRRDLWIRLVNRERFPKPAFRDRGVSEMEFVFAELLNLKERADQL